MRNDSYSDSQEDDGTSKNPSKNQMEECQKVSWSVRVYIVCQRVSECQGLPEHVPECQ